jgi:hypothetical protein
MQPNWGITLQLEAVGKTHNNTAHQKIYISDIYNMEARTGIEPIHTVLGRLKATPNVAFAICFP